MRDNKKSPGRLFAEGVLGRNPVLALGLSLAPALAVTTSAANGLGMGIAAACALVLTCLVVALLKRLIPEEGRLPIVLVVSATFATVASMVLRKWQPELYKALGIFVPLIAVNSLVLDRADFARKNGFGAALCDALGMGVGLVFAMTLIGAVRELLGRGSVFGVKLLGAGYSPMAVALLPAGGLLLVGLLAGGFNALAGKKDKKEGESA